MELIEPTIRKTAATTANHSVAAFLLEFKALRGYMKVQVHC